MKVAIISTRKGADHRSLLMEDVAARLGARGVVVETVYPEERVVELGAVQVEHDLYLLKTGTDAGLAYAGLLHEGGARMINPFPVSVRIRDKILASQTLAEAKVPAPRSFLASSPRHLAPLLADGSLVVKPIRGSRGRGVEIVRNTQDIERLESDGLLFAQSYHEPDGRDRKIYVIGDRVFGVMRKWPAKTHEEKLGEPFAVKGEALEITDRCAEAFGTRLMGIDIVYSDGQALVVDVNAFPGFKGAPDAAAALADYIDAALRA